MTQPREVLTAGTPIGGYVIERLLGHGGMTDVYLARDLAQDRAVALKILPANAASDSARRTRLKLEGRVLQSLRHPNICPVYEVGEAAGRVFLAMEYLEGRTLHDVTSAERLSVAHVVRIGRQIASALEAARVTRVVHRDLKGSNVMVLPSGDVKLVDFGLAKFAAPSGPEGLEFSRHTDPGVVFGTAEFMSPEQALGREVDHRSDLFSLGVLLYELLTGSLPFRGQTRMQLFWAIVNAQPKDVVALNPDVPEDLAGIVSGLLEKDVTRRFQTAVAVEAALLAVKPAARRRAALRSAGLKWFHRLAGSAAGIALALLVAPALTAISEIADTAIEERTWLPASVWAGTDALHDFEPVVRPAINPAAAWISNDGRVIYSTRRRKGRGGLWVASAGREPALIAQDADQASVGRGGSHVYFTRQGVLAGLYRVSLQRGQVDRLADGPIVNPVVSRDGSAVTYARLGPSGYSIWSVPAAGGVAYRLSSFVARSAPVISPDLTRLAVQMDRGVVVCAMPDCGDPVSLPITTLVGWTPDARHLAHIGAPASANIWTTDVRTGAITQITRFTDEMITSVSWSPNGRRLAVTRQRTVADLRWLKAVRP